MVITLTTEEILNRVRTISHDEVAAIADVEARYRAEAGTEKMKEIHDCIKEAHGRLVHQCRRFLRNTNAQGANNTGTLPQTYTFDFILSERRNLGNGEPLAEVMNTFMVEYALAKFYSVVSQGDLSNKHSLLAIDAGKELDVILYTKLPPRV